MTFNEDKQVDVVDAFFLVKLPYQAPQLEKLTFFNAENTAQCFGTDGGFDIAGS